MFLKKLNLVKKGSVTS